MDEWRDSDRVMMWRLIAWGFDVCGGFAGGGRLRGFLAASSPKRVSTCNRPKPDYFDGVASDLFFFSFPKHPPLPFLFFNNRIIETRGIKVFQNPKLDFSRDGFWRRELKLRRGCFFLNVRLGGSNGGCAQMIDLEYARMVIALWEL